MSYYIITEDDKAKAGYQFYTLLNKLFFNNKFVIWSAVDKVSVIPSEKLKGVPKNAGNRLLSLVLDYLYVDLKAGDVLIIAYDRQLSYFGTVHTEEEINVIKKLNAKILRMSRIYRRFGINVYVTNYICFEEVMCECCLVQHVIADAEKLNREIGDNSIEKYRQLCNIRDNVVNKKVYYEEFLKTKGYKTVEKAYKDILLQFTASIVSYSHGRHFKIGVEFGDCWLRSCSNITTCAEYVHNKKCCVVQNFGENVYRRNKIFLIVLLCPIRIIIWSY